MSMFYKKNQPLGTFSSGGHTILNKLKQALTQRTKLMFGGGLKATDNSQDGITLVDDSADEIEFNDWIAKTEEEKETYAEEHAKFDIINAPGVDELVELKLLTKLWENPSPTASFAQQNITLSSDDYDFLMVLPIFANDTPRALSPVIVPKGMNFYISIATHTSSGVINLRRICQWVSNTEYSISGCYNNATANDNIYCIPIVIYGFKTNIKSIISAIASDVSTSASKCMLADGETSVEDAYKNVTILIPPTITDYASYKNAGGNRGEDITKYWKDGSLADRIDGVNGFKPFEDLYLWDYIDLDSNITAPSSGGGSTVGTKRIHIGEFNGLNNYQLNKVIDNTNFFNHLRMVTGTHFGMSKMNDTNTTANGYLGSKMHTTIIGNISTSGTLAKQLYDQLGSLLVPTTELLTNSVNASGYNRLGANSGCSNNWTWADVYARLLSEIESNGSIVWSSSGYDTGNAKHQLPAFKNDKSVAYPQGIYYWLKDVAASTYFCDSRGDNGIANYGSASGVLYVRLLLTLGRKPS